MRVQSTESRAFFKIKGLGSGLQSLHGIIPGQGFMNETTGSRACLGIRIQGSDYRVEGIYENIAWLRFQGLWHFLEIETFRVKTSGSSQV